ncbi:8530_t:CDS:2 [Paraglomus occultum]|uniref:8530_t:CDS:1 n=1 Tax=Paraglomus occultum TaxID=144539 RepID=A0A9N9A741_9GLOM|nr:8530_t:CDS:2 [Paraglomus occultum]
MLKNTRRLLITILQVAWAVLLVAYLIVNTVLEAAITKATYTTTSFEQASALPPLAFSLCSDDVPYSFECGVYGNVTQDCSNLIQQVDVSNNDTFNGWFTRCYVFHTTEALVQSPPPVPPTQWTAFQSPLFVKYSFANASTISKMFLMIWNPFDLPENATSGQLSTSTTPQILDPYRLNAMDACKERVYEFTWNKFVDADGNEKWNVQWVSEFGLSTNAFGTSTSAIGLIHLKPATFQVQTTHERRFYPPFLVFTNFLVLLAALYTFYYVIVAGRGKYRTWGLLHTLARYYPQQHIPPSEDTEALKPTAQDVLPIYLDGLGRAEFEKK